jgi:hypothetical protein
LPLRDENGRSPIPASELEQVSQRIARFDRLFRTAYPQPKGIQAESYWNFRGSGKPYPYALNSLYKAWYCNDNVDRLMVGDETPTWAYVFVNHLNWFASFQKDFQVEGRPVYLLTARSGELKGRPAHAGIGNRNSNTGQTFSRAVLISRPGHSPVRPVPRRAFLEAFLARAEARHQTDLGFIARSSVEPARKAEVLRRTEAAYESDVAPAREKLRTLSPEEAAEPAFLGPLGIFGFKEFASAQKGGQELVYLDPKYFDRRLPAYVPQFVVVYWSWQNNPPSQNFRTEFERNIDLDAIAAMLDR